jgi:hypothetical protein
MPGWEMKIITAEAQRLLALAAEDADLRADLRALAEEILSATEAPPPPQNATTARPLGEIAPEVFRSGDEPAQVVEGDESSAPNIQSATQALAPHTREPLRELTLGRSRPSPAEIQHPPGATTGPAVTDLSEIKARCQLKAEAARRVATRLRGIREGAAPQAEIAPEDPEIIAWADRLEDRFYWMNSPGASESSDVSLLEDVGGCFETVAEGIALVMDDGIGQRGRLEQSLPILAQAQSALRAAIQGIHGPDDPDQLQCFEWLKATAARHHVYIKRFMRADDQADPTRWPDLLDRIEGLHARSQRPQKRPRQQGSHATGAAITHEPTAEVKEARRLLGGRSIALIGGICRRESQEALETALGLKELIWIETREHQSIATFEPAIARPDLALVLLAIRWSSHAFGDVKQFCERYGKPLVRLPGGYSPNQVAAQILAQCSGQLGGES